jgi:uncharacterized protein (TIGR02391 family)
MSSTPRLLPDYGRDDDELQGLTTKGTICGVGDGLEPAGEAEMLEWLIAVSDKCRDIEVKARDALTLLGAKEKDAAKTINGYLKRDLEDLKRIWLEVDPELKTPGRLSELGRHVHFGADVDYDDIVKQDLPEVLVAARAIARAKSKETQPLGFEQLLHPLIERTSLRQFREGHLRSAVLDGVTALYDLIRQRTGLQLDGKDLAGQAFGIEKGRLIFSELGTETGRNDQKGFMQIFEGIYTGVRNVKAHTLNHDLNEQKAAQYLVMLSLLARRIDECQIRHA